jgi:hypothetical protein
MPLPHCQSFKQIGAFCLSAVASGYMFVRWWRLDEDGRQDVWRLYGVFTALMCVGSCVGAAAWSVSMLSAAAEITFSVNVRAFPFPQPNPHYSPSQLLSFLATSFTFGSLFSLLYPVEVLCLSVVKLAVLDRMQHFSATQGESGRRERWVTAGRVVIVLVVAGGVVGICGNIVAVVYKLQAASLIKSAATAAANNSTSESLGLFQQSTQAHHRSIQLQSIQSFSEMCTLLLIIATFIAVGIMCARRVDSSLPSMTARTGAKAKHLRRQIVVTVAVVFVTFLLRAVFASFNALSASLQHTDDANCMQLCSSSSSSSSAPNCPAPLFNKYGDMQLFLAYTPELQIAVVLISSPLALLVALWGMTSDLALQAMKHSTRQSQPMRSSMLRGQA